MVDPEINYYERMALVDYFRRSWRRENGYCSILEKRKMYKQGKERIRDNSIQHSRAKCSLDLTERHGGWKKPAIVTSCKEKNAKKKKVSVNYFKIAKMPIHNTLAGVRKRFRLVSADKTNKSIREACTQFTPKADNGKLAKVAIYLQNLSETQKIQVEDGAIACFNEPLVQFY